MKIASAFAALLCLAVAGCGDKAEAPKAPAPKVEAPSPEDLAKAAAAQAMADEAKKKKDEGDCGAWAKQETGVDPKVASAPAPQQTGPAVGGGERVKGAARGALGGAVIGGIAGDAGTGAAVGATVGVIAGGAKARKNQEAQNQQAQQKQQQALNAYNKAYAACMEGRGYTVK